MPSEQQAGGVAVAEPMIIRFADEHPIETAIHIVDRDGSTLVTAIELLSPSNKLPGTDRVVYERTRREYLAGSVNLVEIDLYRPGDRTIEALDSFFADSLISPYVVIVKRANRPYDEWEVTPLPFRTRLPAVHLPLRPSDPDILLDLQPLIDRVYANGRYPIDYSRDPDPPLGEADAAWAKELLQTAGLR